MKALYALRLRIVQVALMSLSVTLLYVAVVIDPFYVNGIYLRSRDDIARSMVDVKSFPPYTWDCCGAFLLTTARNLALLLPLLMMACCLWLAWVLWTRWRRLAHPNRMLAILAVLLALVALLAPDTVQIWNWLLD